MGEMKPDILRRAVFQKGINKGRIKNPLTAQEEVNSILELIGRASPEGYHIDRKAKKELYKRAGDYVLTAQAEKAVHREKDAKRDALTGLLNRKGMTEEIQDAMEEVKRNGGAVHVVFMDLRGFKKFNDAYGHAVGDQALISLAHGVRQHIRPYDKIGRWGGEEFVLLIKNGDVDIAQTISDRLHNSLRALPKPLNEIHADMGMASYGVNDSNTVSMETLINRADQAMYFAKKNKLNRVKNWDPAL